MRNTQPLLHCIIAVLLGLSLRANANIPNLVIPVTINEKYCPGGGAERKQNEIEIGILGCKSDPTVLTFTKEERNTIAGLSECSNTASGYIPPTPEYVIAALHHVEAINNSSVVLPYHRICVIPSISESLEDNLNSAFTSLLQRNVVIVIDALVNERSHLVQSILLPLSMPMVRFSEVRQLSLVQANDVKKAFKKRFDMLSHFGFDESDFIYTMTPPLLDVYTAVRELSSILNWKRIGLLVAPIKPHTGRVRIHEHNGLEVIFSMYNNADPLQSFKFFMEREVHIFVFHGSVSIYMNVMKFASQHHFTGPKYVWMFAYSGIVFPDSYINLWCGYSQEDIFIIKNALKGSLSIGIVEGFGKSYREYIENFPDIADHVTGFRDVYMNQRRFLPTSYAHDSIGVIADALDQLVQQKAKALNTHPSMVNITSEDRTDFARSLSNITSEGITGTIAFGKDGQRMNSVYSIRNFVPVANDFEVKNSRELDPWVVQIRGYLEIGPDLVNLTYFNENGTESDRVTIVFADGTSSIPSDRPYRYYIRDTKRTLGILITSTTVFILTVIVYIVSIAHQDRRVQLHNDSWIYKAEDIDNSLSDKGIRGRLQNRFYRTATSSLKRSSRTDFTTHKGVGRIRMNGTLVYMKKLTFNELAITNLKAVRQEVNHLRELNHPNICVFFGCILDVPTSDLLYEFCPRGSLRDVLTTYNIKFDWIFRFSFGMDAAKGMAYLHAKKLVHGRLKSKNCVIDDQWVLKITDYGIEDFYREMNVPKRQSVLAKVHRKVSLAPEIRLLGAAPSQASDIFSYGIILQELFTPQQILKQEPAAPRMNDDSVPPQFLKLTKRCLDSRPQKRPSFEVIRNHLKLMSPHVSGVSGVMQMYSSSLEELLDETMHNLSYEKERHNDLMYNFIPRPVVDSIRDGTPVPIQEYSDAAILCVEVTNIEHLEDEDAETVRTVISTIQKVIEGITFGYDVQRVQSTGAMWILATGIYGSTLVDPPIEAANAALALIGGFDHIIVPGLPDIRPSVRIGLHSGSVLSGALEQPVPRHVLLGKTIQTTLQLMLSSQEMKILTSWEVAKALRDYPGFYLSFKGDIELSQGSESIATFWLEEETLASHPALCSPSQRATISSTQSSSSSRQHSLSHTLLTPGQPLTKRPGSRKESLPSACQVTDTRLLNSPLGIEWNQPVFCSPGNCPSTRSPHGGPTPNDTSSHMPEYGN